MKLGGSGKNYRNTNLIFFEKKIVLIINIFIKMYGLKKLLSKPMQIESTETDPSALVGDCYHTAAV